MPGSAAASEQQPGDCTQSLEAPVQLVHHHEHHIPEAVEHELPPDAGAEEVDEDEYIDFDPLLFIKSLPPLEEVGGASAGSKGFSSVRDLPDRLISE